MGTYSSTEVADLVAVPYRMLDYWCRTGVVEPSVPAAGSGSSRRWSEADLRAVRVVAAVTPLGVKGLVLRRIAPVVRNALWLDRYLIVAGDEVTTTPVLGSVPPVSVVVDLAALDAMPPDPLDALLEATA